MKKTPKGMTRETYEHILDNLDLLELDFSKGLVRKKKTKIECKALKNGYKYLNLAGKQVFVHQVLAVVIFGENCIGLTVHHKDEDTTNNHWSNLLMVTNADNTRLQTHNLDLRDNTPKTSNARPKIPVMGHNPTTGHRYLFDSVTHAAEYIGVSMASVSHVLNGRMKFAHGWKFERF